MRRDWPELAGDMGDLWVFGYGSLMWRPGFAFAERQGARLAGYRRALCISSHVHRGTPERPGLVLGLDRGGSCKGVAFRVEPAAIHETMAYLRGRELVTNVYLERIVPVRLEDGSRVEAVTYVVDRRHAQYAGGLDAEEAARRVSGASGVSGDNPDYVMNTVAHLRAMRIHDALLEGVFHWLERGLAARQGVSG
jgi:cation transport protein ChaC